MTGPRRSPNVDIHARDASSPVRGSLHVLAARHLRLQVGRRGAAQRHSAAGRYADGRRQRKQREHHDSHHRPAAAGAPVAALQASTAQESIHYNPPPPSSQTSHLLNPEHDGNLVYNDGSGGCYVKDGGKKSVACPDVMKDAIWKSCANGLVDMADDQSWWE